MELFQTLPRILHVNDQPLYYPNYLSVTQITLHPGGTLPALGGKAYHLSTERREG